MKKTLYHIKSKDEMKLNIQIFKRKQREEAYKGKCLNGCKPEGTARKAVYISREKYKAVRRIAGMAGENGMTISGYIDHILSEHFEQYGAELESLNNRKGHEMVEQITISRW